jgi:predicted PurR-regulated permease PerM
MKEEKQMQHPSLFKPLLILTSAAILLAAMHLAAPLLVLILLAVFFATLLTPLYRWLKQKRVPGGLAVLLTMSFLILVAVSLLLLVGNSLTTLTADLATYADQFSQRQAELAAKAESLNGNLDSNQILSALNPGTLAGVLSFFLDTLGGLFKNSLAILLVTVFVLVESPLFIKRMRQAFGEDHFLPNNVTSLSQMMISYFGLRALVNLVTATASGLMFWGLGIPHAGLWAVLTFFLSFVPYIGAFVAGIPPLLLAYAQGGLGYAILTGVLMVVLNSIAENIVAPWVMGKGLSISPTVVFLSFLFWMFILGGAGAFIAMPLTLAVILFMRSFEETRALAATVIIEPERATPLEQEPGSRS